MSFWCELFYNKNFFKFINLEQDLSLRDWKVNSYIQYWLYIYDMLGTAQSKAYQFSVRGLIENQGSG